MGVIWVQTTSGKIIHLPVVGEDVNSPDDPVKISATVITYPEVRCMAGTVSVDTITHGTVTLDFNQPGRSGACNKCGSCCTHPVSACNSPGECGYVLDTKYDVHKCSRLVIAKGNNKLGTAGNTECSVRTTIFDIAKGCVYEPSNASHILPHMTSCGFTFAG